MKPFAVILILILTATIGRTQDDLSDKVREMMVLSGAYERVDIVVERLFELQKQNNSTLQDDFWDKFEQVILDSSESKLVNALVPVYLKYLSEEDIDGIIAFHKSPAGQHLIDNQSNILIESMDIGEKMGEEMGKHISKAMQDDRRQLFDSIYLWM